MLAALLALPACGGDSEGAGSEVRNVPARFVLVTIDTLRADRVGCYGAEHATTPHLDALAARGVRFENAISPAPLTLPSHATLLTALDPPEHGVRSNGRFRLQDDVPTLAERMQARGFATAAFVSAFVLDRRFGLARGFDHYDDRVGVQHPEEGVASRAADQTVDAALAWLADAPERFLLWLHLYDPHSPYAPPEPHQTRQLGRPYEGEIAFADEQLGRLLAAIDARFPAGGTVVIVTSDHGESLGEHGEATHAFSIYDATQRVPLLMAGPGLPSGAVVTAGLARLADVAPTVLELAGAAGLASPTGKSLLPLVRGEPEAEPRIAWVETLATQLDFGWSPLLGVRTLEHKYVRAPRPELYALASDPGELQNLASEQPELARELDALVEERGAARNASPNLAMDPEVIERLRALGYVAAETLPASERPLGEVGGPDPKEEMGTLSAMQEAFQLLVTGRELEALERLAPLGEAGLEVELARGEAALRAGDFGRARASAQRARDLAANHAPCLVLLGRVAEAEGRLRRGRRRLPRSPRAGAGYRGGVDRARARGRGAWRAGGRPRQLRAIGPALPRRPRGHLAPRRPRDRERSSGAGASCARRAAATPGARAPGGRAPRAGRTQCGRLDLARLRLKGSLRLYPSATELLLAQADLLEAQGRWARRPRSGQKGAGGEAAGSSRSPRAGARSGARWDRPRSRARPRAGVRGPGPLGGCTRGAGARALGSGRVRRGAHASPRKGWAPRLRRLAGG